MSSANGSTIDSSGQQSYKSSFNRSGKGCCAKGNWSPLNIAAMVIGFVLFWPVGLVVLYWNISGRNVQDLPKAAQEKWIDLTNGELFSKRGYSNNSDKGASENSVFDEFQQTQYDRIREIKEEIKNRARNFRDFRADSKRTEDESEFNDFMSSKQNHDEK